MADEEEEKDDKEDDERFRRVKQKFDNFLADISDDMVPEEVRTKVEAKVRRVFTREEIPFSSRYIVAFVEGMNFMMGTMGAGSEFVGPVMATMQGISAKTKKAMKEKVEAAMKESGVKKTE